VGARVRVLIDYHHADLAESLHLLFDRFGWEVYIPVEQGWWDAGVWQFGKDSWQDDRLARQFLTRANVEIDDAHPSRVHNVVTYDEATDMEWYYVVASVPDNYRGYARFAAAKDAKFVIQSGNTNQWIDWALNPIVLNSSEMPLLGRGITYHQEFDLDAFRFSEPTSDIIGSFVNCMDRMPCYPFLAEAMRTLPNTFRIHGIDGIDGNIKPTADVGTLMRSYGWAWHDKVTGDGFGHVIHNWAAVGRPLIGHAGHYTGKMADPLWEDGVTCIDLDRHAVDELPALMADADLSKMGHAIRDRFEELVDYDDEADRIFSLLVDE
jgi:hypothetical protein